MSFDNKKKTKQINDRLFIFISDLLNDLQFHKFSTDELYIIKGFFNTFIDKRINYLLNDSFKSLSIKDYWKKEKT